LNSERARCGAIRNLRKPEYELVIHKSLVIVYNYLMQHQSLKTGEVEFGLTNRKEIMQNEPRESNENNFMALLNFIVDPAVIVDEKGHFLVVNNAIEELTGLSKKELIGTAFLEVSNLTAESKAILLENLMKRMQGLSVEPYEITFTDKTGETRYFEVKAKKINCAGQHADLVIFRDITRRKKNLAKLKEYSEKLEALVDEKVREIKESEEKFRAISTSAIDAIFLVDETGKIIYWNPAAERIFGYTEEEALGKELNKLVIPLQHREPHLKRVRKLKRNQLFREEILEAKALRKDGTEFPIELSIAPLKLKDRLCMLGIVRDISERRKMEADVKQKLDMLEALTENLGVGFVIISKDYHVLWVNRFIKNGMGDVEGKLCYATLNTLDHICPDCGVRKVFEDGVAKDSHEYSQSGVDGNPYYVELIATPLKDKDGNITAALEFVVDIAEKKRMQRQLTEYSLKLEKLVEERTEQLQQTQAKLIKSERLATIGELAAIIGHDLRNPLTGIKGATYYLKTKHGAEMDVKGKEMLEIIEKDIDCSNKIINDLIDYSRDLTLELVNTTPKLLLKNALSLIEVPERIKIIDATEDKLEIKADAEKIYRAFVNIITNAVDAMPESGTLTVTSKAVKGSMEIVFKDTGTGMSEETLSKLKLWSPFFTTKAKGMGFGLPVCKRVIEAHGGKISVESTLGKGTTVTLTIPVNLQPVNEGEEKWIFNESWLSATPTAEGAP
jgi:PAS domain S-box-containing protein